MRRRGVTGPIVIITVGVLFALNQIFDMWSFRQTWPVILIVFGVAKLIERMAFDPSPLPQPPRPWGPTPPTPNMPPTFNMPPQPPPPPGTAPSETTSGSNSGDSYHA